MSMILPERTVDVWTATYITGRRWRARLWAPTERGVGEGYDLAAGLGSVAGVPIPPHPKIWPDKVFVFEHKGVYSGPGGAPVVAIRIGQLRTHLFEDRARGGGLVYYLLPDPDWSTARAAPYGTVPDIAWRRTRGPKTVGGGYAWEGFQRWARVVHVEDLFRRLQQIHRSAPARFRAREEGRDWVCYLTMPEVRALQNQVSLRDFLGGVRRCTHGRLAGDSNLRVPSPSVPPVDSLDDAFRVTERAEAEDQIREEDLPPGQTHEESDLPPPETALEEIFAKKSFVTVYGVGDSDKVAVEAEVSTLFEE